MKNIYFDNARNLTSHFRIDRAVVKDFVFQDVNGNPYDITGYTFEFFVKRAPGDRLKLISLTTNGGGLSFPAYDDNVLRLTLPQTTSRIEEGQHYFEVIRTDAPKTWLNGWAPFSFGPTDSADDISTTITIDESGTAVTVTIHEEEITSASIISALGYTPQTGITFKDEGVALGAANTVDDVDFLGAGVSAARVGNKVSITIPGGGGSITNGSGTTANGTAVDLGGTVGANVNIVNPGYEFKHTLGDGLGAGGSFVLHNAETGESISFGAVGSGASGGLLAGGDYSSSYGLENYVTKRYADSKVADAINDGTTTIAPSQNAVFDALALKSNRRILYKNNTSLSLTGTTAETIIDSFTIPAGTIQSGDILRMHAVWTKAGTAGVSTGKFRNSTAPAALTGSSLGQFNSGLATTLYNALERHLIFKNSVASQAVYAIGSNVNTDITSLGTATTALTIDFALEQVIMVTGTLANSGDTMTLQSWHIEIIRT